LPADVLVVEGWAGRDSMPAAVREFQRGGYRLLVTAGGPTGDSWAARNWNYAELAAEELLRDGLPKEQLLIAPTNESETRRTYHAALAVRRALEARGELPAAINIWTRGAHARRSRLVFAKVFRPKTRVGVIAWTPAGPNPGRWWKSSDRSRDLLDETVAYLFELLLNSGRWGSAETVGLPGAGTTPSWPPRNSCVAACQRSSCSSRLRPWPAVFRYFQIFPLNNPPSPALAVRRAAGKGTPAACRPRARASARRYCQAAPRRPPMRQPALGLRRCGARHRPESSPAIELG
jgi:hypothetical protein